MPERPSPDPDRSWLSRPFVHVRIVAGKTVVRGVRAWFGGHVLRLGPDGAADGIFGAWRADENGVEVRNDRYGCYPLYYFANAQEIAVSPFVMTLLACGAPRELDDEGLAVFVRTMFFLGEHTPFRHIRALPPGCRLRWSGGALQVSGGMVNATERTISRDAAIDTFIDLFAQSVGRRAAGLGPLIVPLSGGRDSRHILLELLRQGHTPDCCITTHQFPPTPDHDVAIASEVARTAGVRHVIVRLPVFPVRGELAKNLWLGLGTEEHAQFLPVMRAMAAYP
ncbi:MAG: asparagine synthetase B family protein, partial [Armatimonadota bacterium]|nr:asparagine synthetase B family protein [Armatimonadota bacterium]